NCGDPHPLLHPETRRVMIPPPRIITPLEWGILCAVCSIAGLWLTGFFGPLRRLTWESSQFQAEVLSYGEEDVGGPEGALTLVVRLQELAHEQKDSLSQWLVGEFNSAKRCVSRQRLPTDATQQKDQGVSGLSANDYTLVLDRMEKAKRTLDMEKAERTLDMEKEKALLQEI